MGCRHRESVTVKNWKRFRLKLNCSLRSSNHYFRQNLTQISKELTAFSFQRATKPVLEHSPCESESCCFPYFVGCFHLLGSLLICANHNVSFAGSMNQRQCGERSGNESQLLHMHCWPWPCPLDNWPMPLCATNASTSARGVSGILDCTFWTVNTVNESRCQIKLMFPSADVNRMWWHFAFEMLHLPRKYRSTRSPNRKPNG